MSVGLSKGSKGNDEMPVDTGVGLEVLLFDLQGPGPEAALTTAITGDL